MISPGPILTTTCPPERADAHFEIVTACSEEGFVEIERVSPSLNEDTAFAREVDRLRLIRAHNRGLWHATTVTLFLGDQKVREELIA